MKDLRKTAEEILRRHLEKNDYTISPMQVSLNAMLEMYNLDRPQVNDKKAFYDYAKSLGISVNDAQRLMNLADVNRPKPIPFDANDPKTFPTKTENYQIKTMGEWQVDVWLKLSKCWENYDNNSITHYAEILMPEE